MGMAGFQRGATKISINLDNKLTATSEAGTTAQIAKKGLRLYDRGQYPRAGDVGPGDDGDCDWRDGCSVADGSL